MRDNNKIAIEEMAKDICRHYEEGDLCRAYSEAVECDCDCWTGTYLAPKLYDAGYRKQSEAEWISVEERMPLNFESVLVLATSRREDDGYDVLIAYHDRGEWEERCVHGDGGTVYAHVKYWMPLPEPPKAKQPKDLKNFEKKRLLAGDCFHGEIWYMCPYCFTGIEAHSIPKDRICHKCGKEYL